MEKLTKLLLGLLLLVMMFTALFLAGSIYDASRQQEIDLRFFQPNNLSSERVGEPYSLNDLGEAALRDMLIKKYVTEYFYIIPIPQKLDERAAVLSRMSSPAAYNGWLSTVGKEIEELESQHILRLVSVQSISKRIDSQYYQVEYTLETWHTPNNMSESPKMTSGILLIDVAFEPGIRTKESMKMDLQSYLKAAKDSAAIFRFKVQEVIQQQATNE